MIKLQAGLNTTIFNIEKNINFHEKGVSKEEVELSGEGFFNILNESLEEFKKIENHLEFTLDLEKTDIFFIVIKASQLEEIKIENFNKVIEKIKLLKVKDKNEFNSLMLPIIIDCKESSKIKSCKYEAIENGYILCKDEEEAKKSIEGILYLCSEGQLIGIDFFDIKELYRNSKKILLTIYEGDMKKDKILPLLKKFKNNNVKRVMISTSGGEWISLAYICNVCELIENYLNIRGGFDNMILGLFRELNYLEGKVRIVIHGIELKDGEEYVLEDREWENDDFQDSDLPDWIRKNSV